MSEINELDYAGSVWLLDYRGLPTEDLAKVMARAQALAEHFPPCVSLWERAYRECLAAKEITTIYTEPLIVPKDEEAEPALTAEQYWSMPSSVVSRKMQTQPGFREQVEKLIKDGKLR